MGASCGCTRHRWAKRSPPTRSCGGCARRCPACRSTLTHTSPSVTDEERLAGADHADYLPLDEPRPIARTLDALRPDLLLLSRGDLWPELVRQVQARGVPVAVTGGIVRSRSGRLRWPARAVLRPACRRLAYVGAVTDGDAERWRRLGVLEDRVEVTGDPRHDQLIERPVNWRCSSRCGPGPAHV